MQNHHKRADKSARKVGWRVRLAFAQASFFIKLMRLQELSLSLAATVQRSVSAEGVEWSSLGMAVNWCITLIPNRRYYADSSYMHPVEDLIGWRWMLTIFVLLVCLHSAYILHRRLTPEPRYGSMPPKLGYLLRIAGFMVSSGVWFFMLVLSNLAMITTQAKTLSPWTFPFGGIVVASAVYSVIVSRDYAATRLRLQSPMKPPRYIPKTSAA